MTRPAPSCALHFRPTRISTATPLPAPRALRRPTACRWPSTAIASTSSCATIVTGPSPNNWPARSTPPTSAACCRTSASATSAPALRRPRAASSASGRPCRIAWSANCDCVASPPLEAADAFLPEFIADFNRRFAAARRRRRGRLAAPAARSRPHPRAVATRASSPATTPSVSARAGSRLPPGPRGRSCAGCRVEVRELLDGRLLALYHDAVLAAQAAPSAAFSPVPRRRRALTATATARPRPRASTSGSGSTIASRPLT